MSRDEESTKRAINDGKLLEHYYGTSFRVQPNKRQWAWLDENVRTCVWRKRWVKKANYGNPRRKKYLHFSLNGFNRFRRESYIEWELSEGNRLVQ